MTQAIMQGSAQDAETIAKLREQLTRTEIELNNSYARLRDAKVKHGADIAKIGEKLIEEANDRGWCEEYDTIIEELNEDLYIDLPVRAREFNVQVHVTLTITVQATDESTARSEASEIARDVEEVIDGHHSGAVVSDFQDSYSYEVEEA